MNDLYALTETTYYILLALVRPCHGYGIMQTVEKLSNERIHLAAGTLYGALNALVDKGWITQLPVEAGSRRKQYVLTDDGMDILENELERLRELVSNGEAVLKGELK
ncbi:MAG: PadR family transcriptional regulator [Solobacterium sp.]|nr:PadR family transcriptional regulator [Solobacterium sp.]